MSRKSKIFIPGIYSKTDATVAYIFEYAGKKYAYQNVYIEGTMESRTILYKQVKGHHYKLFANIEGVADEKDIIDVLYSSFHSQ